MKRIAVLTSGGDAPGMNAAIRAVVRTGIDYGWDMFGVRDGYSGLMAGTMQRMGRRDVGEVIQRGGTILGSSRAPEFRTAEGRRQALESLRGQNIEALVCIGGNGTQAGAHALHEMGFPVVGIASTIDNDLFGSEITIGVDTALNIALEAIDRLKVTASSHRRAFLVEVMGRDCGYLALMSGIAGGAEAVVIPEVEVDPERIADEIQGAYGRGKPHALIVVAEGAHYNAAALEEYFAKNRERLGFDIRATVLGYVQRGGEPSYGDRMLGTLLGSAATDHIARQCCGVLIGMNHGEVTATPLAEVVNGKKRLDHKLLELAGVLAR